MKKNIETNPEFASEVVLSIPYQEKSQFVMV